MDFDTNTTVDEAELDELGIKKKDDTDIVDVDLDTIDPGLLEDDGKEKEDADKGMFGEDAELEKYLTDPYEDKKVPY